MLHRTRRFPSATKGRSERIRYEARAAAHRDASPGRRHVAGAVVILTLPPRKRRISFRSSRRGIGRSPLRKVFPGDAFREERVAHPFPNRTGRDAIARLSGVRERRTAAEHVSRRLSRTTFRTPEPALPVAPERRCSNPDGTVPSSSPHRASQFCRTKCRAPVRTAPRH